MRNPKHLKKALTILIAGACITPATLSAQFIYPVSGSVPSGGQFGDCRDGCARRHEGLDISGSTGTLVGAGYSGTASFVGVSCGLSCGYGRLVILNHPSGYQTYYGHLDSFVIFNGQSVSQNQNIAYRGNTGGSTGPHVHYEIRRNGTPLFIPGTAGQSISRNAAVPNSYPGLSSGSKPAEFDPNTAAWYLRNSNTTGGIDNSFYFGVAGDIPVMGDWDGNGSITPGVFRPSTAQWYLRNSNSNGGVDYTFYFGVSGDIPVVGDWDGNGTFTPGVFRPSTAQWFLRNSNSNGGVDYAFAFGAPGDQPVVGDWDGNRTSTPGVFRPSTAAWYLSNTFNGALGTWFYFGSVNDSAITGDWNADGYWTVGVYRNGIRYLTNSNLNPTTDVVFTYGANHNRHLVWR